MNWRELLYKDIRSFVGMTPPPLPEKRPRRARRERRPGGWAPHYFRKGKYWTDLLTVTRILEGFVHANVPLVGGLRAAAQDAPRYPLWRVMTGHEKDLAGGTSLSDSIRNNSGFFPGFYADLVKAGEDSGTLEQSFATLHEIIQHVVQRRSRVTQYKAYVGAVWLFLLAVFVFLGVKVMPVFLDVVNDLSAKTPRVSLALEGLLRRILETSEFCASHALGFFSLLVLLVIGAVAWKRNRRQRVAANFINVFAEGVVLYTPVFGRLLQKRTLAHIAQVLEKLLAAGMPVDEALDAAAGLDVHPWFADALRRIRARVSGGATLKESFEAEPRFPESFCGFVSLGESSGLLPEALSRLSSLYRRQALKLERILLDVLSPIGVIAAGVGVLLLFESHLRTIAAICSGLVDNL
jgi:type II secretory pathway component PulF